MKAYCINLNSRKDRLIEMEQQAKERGLTIEFLHVDKDNVNPVRGCWSSHATLIKQAKECKLNEILILEDDANFNYSINELPEFPRDYGIIYLGGTVINSEPYSKYYDKALCVLSTHAYIINSSIYDLIPETFEGMPIDIWYSTTIQKRFPCYILKNRATYQRDGYSDIENAYTIDISKINRSPNYPIVPHSINENGDVILQLNEIELPRVSVIVPTHCRKKFHKLMNYNYYNTEYPSSLIEWIFIDSTPNDTSLKLLLPKHQNVKYYNIGSSVISKKRNFGCSKAIGDVILHVDDDDIYDKYHAISRVKCIIKNGVGCVGSTQIPCLDIRSDNGFIRGQQQDTLMEATMGYTKTFWEQKHFCEKVEKGEGLLFLMDRSNNVMQIPWVFVMVACLTHGENITGNDRIYDNKCKKIYNSLTEDLKIILNNLI